MITVSSPFEKVIDNAEKEWKPTAKQLKFLEIPFDIDEGGYGGALGAGKSDILMLMPLAYGFHENPKFKGLFLRRTFPELEQEIIPRSQEFFPSTGAIYNIAKHRWEFPRGGMDIFGHLKDEKDVKKYDTGQFPLIRWDEATSFTGFQYEYLTLRRNRAPTGSGLPSFTRWGSNPGNVGHTYFRKRFIDPYRFGGKIIRDAKTGSKRIFIPATAQDNPHLLVSNPKYYQKLEGISSEAERRAMILGDWYTFEGQVFSEFRIEPLPDEPLNARHVIEPFPIPHWWPKIMGIDWGYKAWTFVIWFAISPNGRVYVYRTFACKEVKIKQWARDICLLSGQEINNVRDVRICHSAVQDIGQEQTLFEQVAEAMDEAGFKCALTKGERNRIGGKQLVHEYLRWKSLPSIKQVIGEYDQELANKIMRMHGNDALQQYVNYFNPEPQELNLPKMQIFSHSPEGRENSELIEVIPTCVYDEIKKEDVKEFDGDDPYDCLRNGLYSVRDYFAESRNEFETQQKIAIIASKVKPEQDQTSFYRMCEKLESTNSSPISIRKRGRSVSGMRRFARTARH